MNVFLEPDPLKKQELQEHLTALLPDWFGQPQANAKYAAQAEILDGYIAESEGVRRGLLLLKWSTAVSAEVYWMVVDPAYHRSGVGRAFNSGRNRCCLRTGREVSICGDATSQRPI
jgi:GNAT superfamily N-acetyltransferase